MEKLLPANIDAEKGVLGSILIDPAALDRVAGFLRPDDFYRDAHRLIFEAILRLRDQGEAADIITVPDELKRAGKMKAVGGPGYLGGLTSEVPTSGNVEYYGRIVQRGGVLRRLIGAAGEIAALAYENDDTETVLDQAERKILAVTQRYLLSTTTDTSMSELMDQYMTLIDERYENRGRIVGIPTGYADLDRLLGGLHDSDLYVLAARPSVGKTAFALNIAYNAALSFQRKVGIFSLEMSREQLAQRFVALDSGVEQQRLRTGRLEDGDWEPITQTVERLAGVGIWIDDEAGIALATLKSRARRWCVEYGVQLILVDYLQLIDTTDEKKRDNREQEVSRISRGLKNLARELKVPVFALAQLSRAVEGRQNKIPMLSDLRESGSIEQEADVVMFIYRDEVYNPETDRRGQADIIVAKHRNGPIGDATLYFNRERSRFGDLQELLSPEDTPIVDGNLWEDDERMDEALPGVDQP